MPSSHPVSRRGMDMRGVFGFRPEDDLLIIAAGAGLLTAQSPSFEDPFGTMA